MNGETGIVMRLPPINHHRQRHNAADGKVKAGGQDHQRLTAGGNPGDR